MTEPVRHAGAHLFCTGLTARWCPVHGDCTCPALSAHLDADNCPLHGPESNHAEVPDG